MKYRILEYKKFNIERQKNDVMHIFVNYESASELTDILIELDSKLNPRNYFYITTYTVIPKRIQDQLERYKNAIVLTAEKKYVDRNEDVPTLYDRELKYIPRILEFDVLNEALTEVFKKVEYEEITTRYKISSKYTDVYHNWMIKVGGKKNDNKVPKGY